MSSATAPPIDAATIAARSNVVAVHRVEHVLRVAELTGLERRAAEPAQIQAQHAMLPRQHRPLRIPHPRVADARMDQHDLSPAARDLDVDAHAVNVAAPIRL